jgi:3-methylfumaryl-CoA hydratase
MSASIEDLQGWTGRQHVASDDLMPFHAQALAAALDLDPPAAGAPLPACWHWLYFLQAATGAGTGPDGHAHHEAGFLPPAPLPRRMWAAGSLHFEAPLIIGTPAERQSTIKSIDLKQGKTGKLVFFAVEHEILQRGALCLREEQTLVYREIPPGPAPLPEGERSAITPDWSRTVIPDPVLLFRYSALTYNGHRIHYDRSYAVTQEFYPALVVHGPLLATLLMNFCTHHAGPAAKFSFRAIRPSFDTSPIILQGKQSGEKVELWTEDSAGFVCMTAQAVLA